MSKSDGFPTLVPDPKNLPAPEQRQPPTIRPGSSMAVVGVFVEVVRARFRCPGTDWLYDDDVKKTKIAIESAFNEDQAHRDFCPGIFIDHDEEIIGRSVIGDRAGQNLLTGKQGFWALESVPILIECVAAKKAESSIIADLTGIFLHASSDLIQAKFGFHEMTPVTRGRTQPFPRDKKHWITPVTFNVQYNLRWTNAPSGPLIQEVIMRADLSGFDNATQYFEHIALAGQPK